MQDFEEPGSRAVLSAAYQLSAGADTSLFSVADLAQHAGLTEEEAWQAMTPLLRQRLLEREADDYYGIAEAGRVAYEQLLLQDRVLLLRTLYELSGGNHLASLRRDGVQQRTGLPDREFHAALNYLHSRRWCSIPTGLARITVEGVQAYERMRQPASPPVPSVTHVTHNNSMNVHNSTVGVAQAGAASVANVTQQSGVSGGELAALFAQLRAGIAALPDEEKKAEALELAEAMEEQAKLPAPKKGLLKAAGEKLNALLPLVPVGMKIYEAIVEAAK